MTILQDEIETLVAAELSGAIVRAEDLTGTQDHWSLEILWEGFRGATLLQQHKRVLEILRPRMEGDGDGSLHAVQIRTLIPDSPS